MSEGKLKKMEKDFAAEVEAQMVLVAKLAQSNQLQQALDGLLLLEKQTRNAYDHASNAKLLLAVVQLCYTQKQWKMLQDYVVVLSKKHGLFKEAVTQMIQEVMTYVDKTPDVKTRLELIDTLRTVTDGKIYVEVERARITRILSKIHEADGKVNEAAEVLQELQVETFGSMERREKTDFILEQIRLNLLRKDYIRTLIVSRKINVKYFENAEVQDLKLRYYELMIQLALQDNNYLDICKHYRQVYSTPSIQEDETKWAEILRFVAVFIVLAPYDNEQSDLIHRISADKNFEKISLFKQFLKSFTTHELMRWPKIEEIYGVELQKLYLFDPKTEAGRKRWADLHHRVVEHNIRVIAKYYSKITVQRLTELLDLGATETEEFLSKLVVSKTIYARIDRIDGVVRFAKKQEADEVVDQWTSSVRSLLDLVSATTHLIAKEEMVQKIATV